MRANPRAYEQAFERNNTAQEWCASLGEAPPEFSIGFSIVTRALRFYQSLHDFQKFWIFRAARLLIKVCKIDDVSTMLLFRITIKIIAPNVWDNSFSIGGIKFFESFDIGDRSCFSSCC